MKPVVIATVAGSAVVALLRFFRLHALPIFSDEAIYLRWGQLIAGEPSLAIVVPLVDPKPPLHSALLALVMSAGLDPVWSGRALSALTGVLLIPAAVLLLREIQIDRETIFAAVALLSVSPFLAFYQRLATADALFATLTVVCVWLALRLGRRPSISNALAFGAALGAAMLTRQVFSLALMPVTLIAVFAACPKQKRRTLAIWIGGVAVAVAILSPYLLANRDLYSTGLTAELRRRMFHHSYLTDTHGAERLSIISGNLKEILLPPGWFWHYLTPPVYATAVFALYGLIVRRRGLAVLLIGWFVLLLAPTVLFGSVTFPRYALSPAIPLILAAAIGLADVIRRPVVVAAAVLALSIMPLHAIWLQATKWDRQPLLPRDHWQYVSGWPAGYAMEQALRWVEARLRHERPTLVTGEGWGIPDDVVWLRYVDDPRVSLRFVRSHRGVPRAGVTETFSETWRPDAQPLALPPEGPVYYFDRFVSGRTVAHDPTALAEDPVVFMNPMRDPTQPADGVVVFRIR